MKRNETWGEAFKALISPFSALFDWRLIWAFICQIIIAGILGYVLHLLTDLTWAAYLTGASIWTIILCFTPAMNIWFIKPLGNHAVVLEHALRKKEKVELVNAAKLQKTNSYRVVWGPALTGKSFMETPLNNQAVNLQRALALEHTVQVSTRDGANHSIKFWTSCTPIQEDECIINLVRHTESVVLEYFKRAFTEYFQKTVGSIENTDALIAAMSVNTDGTPGALIKGFNELFGGKNAIHDEEKERGMQTGDPKCEITIDPRFQRARQALPAAIRKRQAIDALTATVNGQKGVHPDIAANMVSSDAGDENPPAQINKHIIEAPDGTGSRDFHFVLDGRRGN